ncbi:AP-5 complex subunit zeta-1 [Branchiostoma belcheri]|nr:AP-5 complex subunit zeta-1 [Branchiostoma belcheri]
MFRSSLTCGFGRAILNKVVTDRSIDSFDRKQREFQSLLGEKFVFGDTSRFRKTARQVQQTLNRISGAKRYKYLGHFSVESWQSLSEKERAQHSLKNCPGCTKVKHRPFADLWPMSKVHTFKKKKANVSATESARAIYSSINRDFEACHNITFGEALTKVEEAGVEVKKSRAEKQKEKRGTLRKYKKAVEKKWAHTEVQNLLCTRESLKKRQERRMTQYFQTPEEATKRFKQRKADEKAGIKKPKKHAPDWENVSFDKPGLLNHVNSLPDGTKIVYAALARQYGVGDTPHGSTIVKNFLLDNEVNLDRLSTFRVRGKEPKARRCLNKVYSEITGPKTRCNKQVKDEIKDMLKSGELSMGELIVPQTHTKVTLKDGKVIEEEVTTAGRKIPLNEIQEKLLKKHVEDGFLRPQENYDIMDETTVTRLLEEINENNDTLWLDHSTILNTGYLLVTVHTLYDPAVYYTAKELEEQGRGQVDIQSEVEKPEVYLLARSRASIAEQLLYSDCQRSDLQSLSETVQYKDNQVTDWMRCFIGDGPAQWVEAGEQHMGTYGCSAGCGAPMSRFADLGFCFRRKVKSLEERRQVVVSLPSGASENNKGVCPFKGLKKEELLRNLEATGMEYDTTGNKSVLEQELKEHLKGVSHVPALCFGQQNSTMSEINLLKYEVSPCEPLHVTKEHIKNVFEELPHHLNAKDKPTMNATIKALQQDKEQLRGVDFRKQLLIVTAAMSANNADTKVVQLLSSLATIVHILYTQEKDRSPRLVLRLANLTYMHCMLLREVIGTVTRALTPRKMYGTYYHSLSTHAPLLFRLSNLRSLNAESQERMFSKLKGIYAQSSRRPGEDGMGVLRLQAELSKSSSESKEESEVSALNANLRKILPEENTTVPWEYITTRNFQPHLERISDYLECGEGIWWHQVPTGIEFHDGPKEVNTRTSPTLHHFRSSSMKQEQQYLRERWNECVKKLCDGDLTLPHTRIKICNGPDVSFHVHDEHLQETADDRELEERELEERELEERELEERELEERELEERELEEREQEERELEKRELEEQGRGHVDIQRELEDREFEGPLAIEDVFPRQAEDREKEGKEEVTFIKSRATTTSTEDKQHAIYKTTLCQNLQCILGDCTSLKELDETRQKFKMRPSLKEEYNRKLATIQSQVLRKYGEVKEAIKAWEAQFFFSTNNEPTYDDAKKEGVDILYKQRDQAVKFLEHWRMDGLK